MDDNNYIQGRAEREGVCVEGGEEQSLYRGRNETCR